MSMVVIGVDPHKRTHTAVAVDEVGRWLGQITVGADQAGLLRLWMWAARFGTGSGGGQGCRWAVEDGRALAGRLVRGLIGSGAGVGGGVGEVVARGWGRGGPRGEA